jgi:ketosteroid isomerase-like protein
VSFVTDWAEAYERAWLAGDAEAAGALYTEDCTFRSQPFLELENAQDYARRVYQEAAATEVWFGDSIEEGDRAVVEWWALLVTPAGEEVTLAGCSLLRFRSDGKAVDSRDYWHEEPGHRRPPEGWRR